MMGRPNGDSTRHGYIEPFHSITDPQLKATLGLPTWILRLNTLYTPYIALTSACEYMEESSEVDIE